MFQHEKSTRNASRDVLLILIKFNGGPPNITKECFTLKTSENSFEVYLASRQLPELSEISCSNVSDKIFKSFKNFDTFNSSLGVKVYVIHDWNYLEEQTLSNFQN